MDNKITLTIPALALSADTPISILPLTNTAHGGIGGGFRLTPDGLTFSQPVTLTFTYADNDLAGSDPAMLGAAFQTNAGYWQWLGTPVIDETAHTVSITTTHFTDFSLVKGYQLQPGSKTLQPKATQALEMMICYPRSVADGDPQPLAYACDGTGAQSDVVAPALISEWSVNGIAGGNSTVGTVSGSGPHATYTAPATKPSPATVAVSARVDLGTRGKVLVVSNITIADSANGYTGTIEYSSTGSSYTAVVTWTEWNDGDDTTRSYRPTGTITADITAQDCNPIHATAPIVDLGNLVVYLPGNATSPNRLQFDVESASVDLAYTCTGGNFISSQQFFIGVAGCGVPNNLPAFADEADLSGTEICGDVSVTWHFTRQ